MNQRAEVPSTQQRWIVGLVGAVALALTIIWMFNIYFIQLALIGGFLALLLEGLFLAFLWRHGVRRLFSRRGLAFVGWVVAGLISLVLLFYAEENWRGRRAWAAVERGAAARGESLEYGSIFPPAVPDEQNFAHAPGISNLLAGPKWDKVVRGPDNRWPVASWALEQFTDLSAWGRLLHSGGENANTPMYRPIRKPAGPQNALEVLRGFEQFEPQLQAVTRAATRPGNRFDLDYTQGLFVFATSQTNPYEQLARTAELLCVRASAQLILEKSEAALQDVLAALRLADCLKNEPLWDAHARRRQELMQVLQPVWEGLAMRRWTEPQLAALQARLEGLNLPAELRWSVRADTLTLMNLADQFEAWRQNRPSSLGDRVAASSGSDRFTAWLAREFYPTGWLYQDKAWMYRICAEQVHRIDSANPAEYDWRAELKRVTDPMLLVFVVPRFRELFYDGRQYGLYLNAVTREAALACALERYHLANGRYPEKLQQLVPAFFNQLPADLLAPGGKTYHYRPNDTGFDLYSIGLDLVDQGGEPSPAHDHGWDQQQHLFPRVEEGDWVWRQPAPAG